MKKKIFIFLLLAVSFPLSRLLASEKIPYGSYSTQDILITRQIRFEIPPSKRAGVTKWDGTKYPKGINFYNLMTDNYSETKKWY